MSSLSLDAGRVGILGAGPFGLALGSMLAKGGRPVTIWSTTPSVAESINRDHACDRLPGHELPEGLVAVADLGELVGLARFLVLAVSSESACDRLQTLGAVATSSHIAVHALGALAPEGDRRISQLIADETPILRSGVVAGPSMAADIAAGRTTSLVCASEFDEVTSESRRLLSVPSVMRLYRSRDVIGAELASALSGAYTIAIGLADGLDVGIGTRAVLVTRAISEMTKLGTAMGGTAKTFSGLAGLGNLLVRSSVENDRISPSYSFGLDLVKGPARVVGEGPRAAIAGLRLARSRGISLPILETVGNVIAGEVSARDAASKIFETVTEEE
ncbi:MAG: hypothetical protein GY811_19555 [Myxococcales bacterium]|nr:hypothetical protein [Myxococcales bacterium]